MLKHLCRARFALLAAFITTVAGAGARSSAIAQTTQPGVRERLSLDRGWCFHLGDVPFPEIQGHDNTYSNAKAGKAWGAAAPEYDDSGWRQLDLPHDWVVEGPFDPKANVSQGYRPRGVAWYRRHIQLDPSEKGRHLELQFDGVATHCTVWFNGNIVHRNWCGYTSFYIDITPLAEFGDDLNTVVVRVDAEPMEGWWYEGGGIYRHTWLVERDLVHIVTDGVYANPVREADGKWVIPVEATLENSGAETDDVDVEAALLDPEGKEVARAATRATVGALEQVVAKLSMPVARPRLWSVDEPTLYHVRTVVRREGAAIDEVTTACGFRTIRFDAGKGFFLNDKPLKIKGVCNHQDAAGVGVAVPDSLLEFRLRKLKEMGANAYRCAHNPPAAELLDACDRMGMLVMDENRQFNPSPEGMGELEWMVRRDRNHPSVILWSVFNEEPMQGSEQGYEMVRRMVAAVKRLDATRAVTAAMSNGMFEPVNVAQAVDVVGFNYQIYDYDGFHAANPKIPMTSSEDTSAVMTRGEYVTDKKHNLLDSYDTQFQPWGSTQRAAWEAIAERPYLAGGFVWAGFDYRGEPQPFVWPAVSSVFGCMDVCGFPKTAFYLRQALWITDRPILQLVPHWNWAGKEGQPIKVMALTNADSVSLSLNGQLIATSPVEKYQMVSWEVPYAPGRLEAVAMKGGKEVARTAVETTGAAVALRLLADRAALAGDGCDAEPITVEAVDGQGRAVPTADNDVGFEIAGGAIIGVGNGDSNSHEPEKGNRRSLFNGLAQVIVQTLRGSAGSITLGAKSAGLTAAEVTIDVSAVAPRAAVAELGRIVPLPSWRMSPPATTAPDGSREISEREIDGWVTIQAGSGEHLIGGDWAVYRTTFRPLPEVGERGGRLVFQNLMGRAEVWEGKNLLGKKTVFGHATFAVPISAGDGERTITVVVQRDKGQWQSGFGGTVTVRPVRP